MKCPVRRLTINLLIFLVFEHYKKTGIYQPDDQQWDEVCSECLNNQNTPIVRMYSLSTQHKLIQFYFEVYWYMWKRITIINYYNIMFPINILLLVP